MKVYGADFPEVNTYAEISIVKNRDSYTYHESYSTNNGKLEKIIEDLPATDIDLKNNRIRFSTNMNAVRVKPTPDNKILVIYNPENDTIQVPNLENKVFIRQEKYIIEQNNKTLSLIDKTKKKLDEMIKALKKK